MHVALDIDDTITHAPHFFNALTSALGSARVTVITFRQDRDDAAAELATHGIRYDDLITSGDPRHPERAGESMAAWKARIVGHIGADVFFEDMPEVIHLVEPPVKVFMTCDDVMRDWLRESLERGGA